MMRGVRFAQAIDRFLDDMRVSGRITSRSSERAYTDVLRWHEQDSETKDPQDHPRGRPAHPEALVGQ
jgi:hypothetical protein